MRPRLTCLAIAGLCVLVCMCLFRHPHAENSQHLPVVPVPEPAVAVPSTNLTAEQPPPKSLQSKIRHRAAEFSADEKAQFLSNFEGRYKPAINNWFKAYNGHLPFDPNAVTADTLVECIGVDPSFGENVFVVDGITLGVRDSGGIAQVDYLNDPKRTRKMATLPNGAEAPIADFPVNRQEITQMVAADSGTQFPPDEIRMIPSGFSGGLNGGVLVHIGGDARNGATWKFDMVFGADGKLAYYLRGQQ